MTNDLRPGVFSAYTVTSGTPAERSEQYAAVCAPARGGEAGRVYRVTTLAEAEAVFTGTLLTAARLLLGCGVAQVVCVPATVDGTAPNDEAYGRAFAAMEELDNIGAVVCDCPRVGVQRLLLESVERSCKHLKERIAVVTADTADMAEANAKALDSERVCLCWPPCRYGGASDGFVTACAFTGRLLTSAPAAPLSGEALSREVALASDNVPESEVQRLLRAGVTVFETTGAGVECIRAVTTRTKTGGVDDATFRNLSTVRIIDSILGRARAGLKLLLRSSRSRGAALPSIVSQMTVLLAEARDEGLVNSFEAPRASLSAEDPSVCVVELAFEAATAINQIHIMAHISV